MTIANGGTVNMDDSTISLTGPIVIESGGVYHDPTGSPDNTAGLEGGSVSVTDGESFSTGLSLSGRMVARSTTTTRIRGGDRPPILRALAVFAPILHMIDSSTFWVGGDFIMELWARVQVGSVGADPPATMMLGGDFNNQGIGPSLFNWTEGVLILNGDNEQVFEVGGLDLGQTLEGYLTDRNTLYETSTHTNFSMGTIQVGTVVDPTMVRFVNNFANTAGAGPCQEALYVDTLILEVGSTITLDNVNVYYKQLTDNGATIVELGCGRLIDVCFESSTPVLEALSTLGEPLNRKNRFISVAGTDAGRQQAIRVVVGPEDLGRGAIPPPFDAWQYQEYHAGEPRPYCENAGQGSSVRPDVGGCGPAPNVYDSGQDWFWAASLVCDPQSAHFEDWSERTDYCNTPGAPAYDAHPCQSDADCGTGTCGVDGVIHLYHEAIVPSHMAAGAGPIDVEAVYEVSLIDSACMMGIPSSYSAPAQVHQSGCGDVNLNVAECPNDAPEESVGVVTDVVGILSKFTNSDCAMQKTRADLVPCNVDFNIGITDVLQCLNAFGGGDYEDTCGTGQCGPLGLCKGGPDHNTPCTNDSDCSSDACGLDP